MQGEYISGFLITQGGGPDNSLPRPPHHPDNSLPGVEGPVDPGYGYPLPPVINGGPPNYIDIGLPGHRPSHPISPGGKPTYPVDPDYGIPVAPGVWPNPPITTWPPPQPVRPSHPIYPGIGPDHELPMPPGSVWPPLPPEIKGKILCFVWIVGVGYRWTVIDPSLHIDNAPPGSQPGIDNTLPGSGNRPSNELPPHPQPKR